MKKNIFTNLVQSQRTAVIKSAVGHSEVPGRHTHSPLTHCLTQSHSSPASSTHGKCPVPGYHFYLLFCIFTGPFLYLDMFRYTNTCHYVRVAYTVQYSNTYKCTACVHSKLCIHYMLCATCIELCLLGRCMCTR